MNDEASKIRKKVMALTYAKREVKVRTWTTRLNLLAMLCIVALIISVVAITTPGPQGLQGVAGPAGVQGVSGTPGMVGAAGAQGTSGPQGVPGLIGLQGPIGPEGIKGNEGVRGTIEVSSLTSFAVSEYVVRPGQSIWVYGVALLGSSEVEIWLFDSRGLPESWYLLGVAVRETNNSFSKNVTIPDEVGSGVAELSIRLSGSSDTYRTLPILVED